MKPTVNKNKCTGCGTCVDVCPMDVFELKEKAEVKNPDECIGCRACELQCPEQAITVSD
ncbi:MAG: 4Fe-4S dicluster domain-containing protein [Nanobdellota archaeon]